jgi:transcriptional regulator with XRE-family HTH domain
MPNNIREFRRKKNWNQDELAAIAGLSKGAVSAHESGRIKPSDRSLNAYAYALGCSVEELEGRSGGYQVFTQIEWKPSK